MPPAEPSLTIIGPQAFAGVISLLNDFRLSQGKPSLGFLNPILAAGAMALSSVSVLSNALRLRGVKVS